VVVAVYRIIKEMQMDMDSTAKKIKGKRRRFDEMSLEMSKFCLYFSGS
jgi:hypothetical protein